ncbi:sulfite exporter TauE/SafE family protein [Amaricoccus macauensis]|uniref:sulfite exporter TauE/SafE family protein n=1 Tax=Amaricoccus macauensis TaxID=57001 RepID=UPI003C7C0755
MLGLDGFLEAFGVTALIGAAFSLGAGGFTKGVVGFALPLVALSAMASFLPYETALALLILPTLVSNVLQALRNGLDAAMTSLRRYWRLVLFTCIMIAVSAQLVVALPDAFFFALLGITITLFGLSQSFGWQPRLPDHHLERVETGVGLVAGFFGGISGVWGPPVVMYLIARHIPKAEMVRVQALVYGVGSVILTLAHSKSGVLNNVTLPVSFWLILPTMAAMFLGYKVQDRLDQAVFRKVTLWVLVAAGLNLLRRAAFG